MELNAFTRWESLHSDLDKLQPNARVVSSAIHRLVRRDDDDDDDIGGRSASPLSVLTSLADRRSTRIAFDLMYNIVRRFVKGFAIGSSLQSVLTAWKFLLRRGRSRSSMNQWWSLVDVARMGCFVALFLSLFDLSYLITHLIQHQIERHEPPCNDIDAIILDPKNRQSVTSSANAFISGCVAGSLSILIVPAGTYRQSISLVIGVRGLEVATRLANHAGILPNCPHADTLLMSVSSAHVLWAWLFNRSSLDKSYRKFLDHQGGKNRIVNACYAFCMAGNSVPQLLLNKLNQHRHAIGLGCVNDAADGCEILHPGIVSCTWATCSFFLEGLTRALPVYVPVYLLPLLIFKTRNVVQAPWQHFSHSLLGIARSSVFLSSYCSMAWAISCLIRDSSLFSDLSAYVAGLFAGATVSIEKKPRRIELALYVLTQALRSLYSSMPQLKESSIFTRYADILAFMLSSGLICHAYMNVQVALRKQYVSLLNWMFTLDDLWSRPGRGISRYCSGGSDNTCLICRVLIGDRVGLQNSKDRDLEPTSDCSIIG